MNGFAAVFVIELVGIEAHVLGAILNYGIQPLSQGHTGTAGGILGGLARFEINPFDAPGNGFVHIESIGAPRWSGTFKTPIGKESLRDIRHSVRQFSINLVNVTLMLDQSGE